MKNLNWLGKGLLRVSKVRKAMEYAREHGGTKDIERALGFAVEAGLIVRLSAEDLGRVLIALDKAYNSPRPQYKEV
jgi:hypothetical protein